MNLVYLFFKIEANDNNIVFFEGKEMRNKVFNKTLMVLFIAVGGILAACSSGSGGSSNPGSAGSNFIIVGDQGSVVNYNAQSNQLTDLSTPEEYTNFNAVAYGGGNLVIGGGDTLYTVSTKNGEWTFESQNHFSGNDNILAVIYNNGRFIAGGGGAEAMLGSSIDGGITWKLNALSESKSLGIFNGIAYGNGKYVAIGSDIFDNKGFIATSINGESWSLLQTDFSTRLSDIAYGNGKFVVVADNSALVSTNGESWVTESITSGGNYIHGIIYGNGKFVAVGESGVVATSINGASWESQSAVTSKILTSVAYGGNQFVAIGQSGTVITSKDAKTWSVLPAVRSNIYNNIKYVGSY